MTALKACIVGGGVGGLACASFLRRHDVEVTLVEAAPLFGGLASGLTAGGLAFDGGPYILLDRPGLAWAFAELGMELETELSLRRVGFVYEVRGEGAPPVKVFGDLDETVSGLEASFPGSAAPYRRFIEDMRVANARLRPLLTHESPGAMAALRTGAFRALPLLLASLGGVLERTGLAAPVRHALAIWTPIAGQDMATAPSPLAFVPALIHSEGCYVPVGGVAAVATRLEARARELGATLRARSKVSTIRVADGRVTGVALESGEEIEADIVVSNAGGVGTLLELVPGASGMDDYVEGLPLQSPGVAAFLATRAPGTGTPYMKFWRADEDAEAPCRLLVQPSALDGSPSGDRVAARVIAPLSHAISTALAADGQQKLLDRLLGEERLSAELGSFEVLERRTPRTYGSANHLYKDSMNPVMTAAFMRKGRLPHRLATPRGLYLVGSATHPGQWVSFCAISGILGAKKALRDHRIELRT
ncbi:phytoene desaturase [soil metagenome]